MIGTNVVKKKIRIPKKYIYKNIKYIYKSNLCKLLIIISVLQCRSVKPIQAGFQFAWNRNKKIRIVKL